MPLLLALTLALQPPLASEAPMLRLAEALAPFDAPQPAAGQGDWRSSFPERKQDLREFLSEYPPLPASQRLYVVAVGALDADQAGVLAEAIAYLRLAYPLAVERLPDVPESAVRSDWQLNGQWHAPTVLVRVLVPLRPPDTAALLAFTATDLTPGQGWNFVYGLAMPKYRVGIWSLARLGDADPKLALRRVLVTAAHETGHMLGLEHCAGPRCLMNGANSLAELDRTPLLPCGEDAVRLLWRLPEAGPGQALALADFLRTRGLTDDANLWAQRGRHLAAFGPLALPTAASATLAPLESPQVPPLEPLPQPAAPKGITVLDWLILACFPFSAFVFFWVAARLHRPKL